MFNRRLTSWQPQFPWVIQKRGQMEKFLNEAVRIVSREELAVGGTGLIDRITYSNGHREVEKVLLPRYQGKPNYESLQQTEFDILSSLDHPLIVKALRFRQEEKLWGTTGIISLEHIDGVPLSNFSDFLLILTTEEREAWANELFFQLASLLHYLHSRQIIHGDLAPENILIQPSGFLKLIDFGVARRAEDAALPFKVIGRSQFQADELRSSGGTSLEGDVYSLGRIFEYYLGDELAAKPKYQTRIHELIEARKLPQIEGSHTGWLEGLSPLPERPFFFQKGEVRKKTVLLPRKPLFNFAHPVARAAALFGAVILLSSYLPQRAVITVNSWPYSSVSIDRLGRQFQYETPIQGLSIPSGPLEVEFVIPSQKHRRVVRRINVRAGDHVKLFEDFENLDTLKK